MSVSSIQPKGILKTPLSPKDVEISWVGLFARKIFFPLLSVAAPTPTKKNVSFNPSLDVVLIPPRLCLDGIRWIESFDEIPNEGQ
jgi:hypothetical protein